MHSFLVDATHPRPTDTGVERAVDVDVTITMPRTARAWWAWHDRTPEADRDGGRPSYQSTEDAKTACLRWVAGESDEGPGTEVDGEVTLLPAADGRPGYGAWGQPDHWVSAGLLRALEALSEETRRRALSEIEAAASAAAGAAS